MEAIKTEANPCHMREEGAALTPSPAPSIWHHQPLPGSPPPAPLPRGHPHADPSGALYPARSAQPTATGAD